MTTKWYCAKIKAFDPLQILGELDRISKTDGLKVESITYDQTKREYQIFYTFTFEGED